MENLLLRDNLIYSTYSYKIQLRYSKMFFDYIFVVCINTTFRLLICMPVCLQQGLLEARQELRPLLNKSQSRLKDLLFLDIALDSAVRTAVERGYEELNNAGPEVIPCFESFECWSLFLLYIDIHIYKDMKLDILLCGLCRK